MFNLLFENEKNVKILISVFFTKISIKLNIFFCTQFSLDIILFSYIILITLKCLKISHTKYFDLISPWGWIGKSSRDIFYSEIFQIEL